MPAQAEPRSHVLTVNLEDYFQVGAFNRYVQRGQWDRFQTRLPVHARTTLELLDKHGATATFFVLGWVAENYPEVVRDIVARGHEVASRGYYHRSVAGMTPGEFRDDLARARSALERATGKRVVGYRTADGWLRPDDLWVLDILAAEGYAYDSSICPRGRRFAAEPWRGRVHSHKTPFGTVTEFPVSAVRAAGVSLPVGGGNWVRQLPGWLTRAAAARWDAGSLAPFVMYFQTWELDPEQPRLSTAGPLTRVRHYRNLGRMSDRVAGFLSRFRFTSAADWLRLDIPDAARAVIGVETPPPAARATVPVLDVPRTPVTVVVPLFNEELLVPFLANTLDKVRSAFAAVYQTRFVLVDDGSTDATWDALRESFAHRADVRLIRHERNRGVAAAIMTGVRAADTEIVCSMDGDCTYDPIELANMIPLLADGVDLVTASPYHPDGGVRNVPGWRLLLSKGASGLYRRVFLNQLRTYTSCFRVYRREAVKDIELRHGNFLGVVELLGRLDHAGRRVVEYPTVLNVRLIGRSKMKTLRTIAGHLKLMTRFAAGKRAARKAATADRNKTLHLLFETAGQPCHVGLEQPQTAPPAAR